MDFRDFIEVLRKNDQLAEINAEVDWNLEASAFSMMMGRTHARAMLFNKVKGYPPGYRMMTGMYAAPAMQHNRRAAMALGLDPNCTAEQFSNELLRRMASPLKPVEVATGSCKEVIKTGKDINLMEFPFPAYARGDGGRYSVSQAHICKDPDSDWVNWANYRAMLYSRNRYCIGAQVGAQFEDIFIAKYLSRNQSMPVATVIGGDPLVFWVSGMAMPPGVSEADIAGGLRQSPLELVKCETSDILVPADAEIVIEGEVRPNEYLPEGPLSESSQFQATPRLPNYGVRVTCITHRKDPIVPVFCQPFGCDLYGFMGVFNAAWDSYVRFGLGLPIKAGGYGAGLSATMAVDPAYPGMVRDAADRVMQGSLIVHTDNLAFVDGDVNPFDLEQLMEAQFTQVNPARDIWFTDNDWPKVIAMSPFADDIDMSRDRLRTGFRANKRIVDGTTKGRPRVPRINFETSFPPDLQKWVVDNWTKLGFKESARWSGPYLGSKPAIRL